MPRTPKQAAVLREIHALRNEGFWRVAFQAVVVGGGTGLVIGAFRSWYDYTTSRTLVFLAAGRLHTWWGQWAVFGTLIAMAVLLGILVRQEPLLSGSGIPQVELTLAGKLPMPWVRILIGKFVGTWTALAGGLSVGREGPSIQMGAAVGWGLGHFFHSRSRRLPRFLIGGGVAGLTAAFGAPLAGIFFAFEEMKSILTVPLALFVGITAATAWAVVRFAFGFGLVFPFPGEIALSFREMWLFLVLGPLLGVFGAGYNAVLLKTVRAYDAQTFLPPVFKPTLPFIAGGVLLYTYPYVLSGVGVSAVDLLSGGFSAGALALLLVVKIAFSVFSFASGVPGGLLMPMLAVGGIAGALAGTVLEAGGLATVSHMPACFVLCMAGLFAATVRAPLTGAFLVTEMAGAYGLLPVTIAVSFLAACTAGALHSLPVYDSLKQRILDGMEKRRIEEQRRPVVSGQKTSPPDEYLR